MPSHVTVVAVDLGASSGRVMLGHAGPHRLDLTPVHRFANEPVHLPSGLHWDAVGLFREVLAGLAAVPALLADGERVDSIGIDTWAIDYGLLDATGALLGTPYCYRDGRGAAAVGQVHALVPPRELYARNGLQFLPFTTLYQLAAEQASARWPVAATLLLLPDLLGHWLTGEIGAETTNASTTGLLDAGTRRWDADLAERLGIPAALLPPLRQPGDVVGRLLPHVAERTGLPATTPVVAVGSHDTASAVAAVPAAGHDFGYVSSGTWSLVGLELDAPVRSEAARAANFTNEAGLDGTVRFLRNVSGLWLLSESLRAWGAAADLAPLLVAAAELPDGGPVIDPDDAAFLPPGDMPARIAVACRRVGLAAPRTRPGVVRCILDSLADAYARALADAARVAGRDVRDVHVVGGGSRNDLLCRLAARATGRDVVAGPVEATALGNVLVQARSLGALGPPDGPAGLAQLRSLVRRTQPVTRYRADGGAAVTGDAANEG